MKKKTILLFQTRSDTLFSRYDVTVVYKLRALTANIENQFWFFCSCSYSLTALTFGCGVFAVSYGVPTKRLSSLNITQPNCLSMIFAWWCLHHLIDAVTCESNDAARWRVFHLASRPLAWESRFLGTTSVCPWARRVVCMLRAHSPMMHLRRTRRNRPRRFCLNLTQRESLRVNHEVYDRAIAESRGCRTGACTRLRAFACTLNWASPSRV